VGLLALVLTRTRRTWYGRRSWVRISWNIRPMPGWVSERAGVGLNRFERIEAAITRARTAPQHSKHPLPGRGFLLTGCNCSNNICTRVTSERELLSVQGKKLAAGVLSKRPKEDQHESQVSCTELRA
jgi:hypothetical protein